jgi:hypothetical protein
LEEALMRKQSAMMAVVVLISCGVASAQEPGAPSLPETTGQGTSFEDRWSAQRATPDHAPLATPSEPTGQTPSMSKKMGPEMESVGDQRASPDDQ